MKEIKKILTAAIALSYLLTPAAAFAEGAISQQVIVRFETVSDLFYDPEEQTTAILSYTCERPYALIDSNPEAAEAINSTLDGYYAKYLPASEGLSTEIDTETYMLSLAEDYYAVYSNSTADVLSYLFTFSHRAYVTRCDDSVIVFSFSDYMKDTENSSTESEMFVFDSKTGERLDSEGYLASPASFYPEPVLTGSGYYSIVPAEQFASDPASETTGVIDLLEADADGNDYYLDVSGKLYDVRFSRVVYYDRCYEKEQLWYCNIMDNEALQLKFSVPEGDPSLKISVNPVSKIVPEQVIARDAATGLLSLKPADNLNSLG